MAPPHLECNIFFLPRSMPEQVVRKRDNFMISRKIHSGFLPEDYYIWGVWIKKNTFFSDIETSPSKRGFFEVFELAMWALSLKLCRNLFFCIWRRMDMLVMFFIPYPSFGDFWQSDCPESAKTRVRVKKTSPAYPSDAKYKNTDFYKVSDSELT